MLFTELQGKHFILAVEKHSLDNTSCVVVSVSDL